MRRSRSLVPGTAELPGLLLLLAIATVLASPVAAQHTAWQAARYTVADGLAQNVVNAVAQDSAGFLWVATPRGLQRFDGYAFLAYATLDPGAPPELAGSIGSLLLDRRGRLWVGTPRAIFRLEPRLRSTVRIPMRDGLRAWAPDSAGRLWFLDGGSLESTEMEVESPVARQAGPENGFEGGTALATTHRGAVWVARLGEGSPFLVRFTPSTGRIESFRPESVRIPTALREDATGRVWLAANDGAEVLEVGSARFRSLAPFRGKSPVGFLQDRDGGLLAATDDWLARIDSSGQIRERWSPPEAFGVGTLPRHLALDREGGVWIATTTSGIIRLDRTPPIFAHHAAGSRIPLPLASDFVMAVHEHRDGTLWVGTFRGGAYRVAADWSRVEAFRHDPGDPRSLASDEVWDFADDRDGNLWVATTRGLCGLRAGRFRCYPVPGPGVAAIATDAAGWFWLALGTEGVSSFDPATGRFGETVAGLSLPRHLLGVVAVFVEPDSSYLWIGNGGTLLRARVNKGRVVDPARVIHAAGAAIFDVHRDRRHRLWLGTDDGLLGLDSTERFVPVEIAELRGTTVFSIASDRAGRLWLGTAHGLVRYDPEAAAASRYTRSDGFLSGELNRRAALLRGDGTMLFGGIQGLTQFDPEAVVGARTASPVAVTRWRKVTAEGPREAYLDGVEELRLDPGDRAFTLEFAAMTFAAAPGQRYRYRLQGLSPDWVETTERIATFAAPRPGKYVFQVQTASGSEGAWSDPGRSVSLHVVPPFWATAWFRAMLALLLAALLWSVHRFRLRHAVSTERLRLRISRDLHDEIGAGLSSIALLSDSAGGARPLADPARSEIRRIGESARTMVGDLRDIVWAIDPEADRLEDVVARMQDVAAGLLHGVRLSFEAPARDHLTGRIGMSARRDLLLLYKELLHNIAKHARASEVRIALVPHRAAIELIVSDNGVGFTPNGSANGTGLKSLRERAERLGGQLDLQSKPGSGTTVRLMLKRT